MKIVRFGTLLALLASALPVHAVVTASSSYNANAGYGDVVSGTNLSGVVAIATSIGNCSGSLLSDGYSILTAAHCVTSAYGSPVSPNSSIGVTFQLPGGGTVTVKVSGVLVDPGYNGSGTNGSDLAILTLSQQAPSFAVTYSLFTGTPVFDTPVVIAGYGEGGTGDTGADGSFGTLQVGENEYMGNGQQFFHDSSQLLVGEFYENGDSSTNALGCDPAYFYECSTATPYTGSDEVDISPGDSGGPTFYDGEIIGVHDLQICATSVANGPCSDPPSINSANNAYFGEMFADTSAAANLAFIDAANIPEPGTMGMLGFGATAVIAFAHRRRRKPVSEP